MGQRQDGSDSLAVQIAPQDHWPDMRALICVVSDAKKGTLSTAGMQRTVETSALLQQRIKYVVSERMTNISRAIVNRNFDDFALHTMKDSNQFHACCLDTDPPIFYLNDVSRAIISLIVELNRVSVEKDQGYKAAYTFDAGPNAVIFAPERHMREIISLIHHYFFSADDAPVFDDRLGLFTDNGGRPTLVEFSPEFNSKVIPIFPAGSVKDLIHTCVGDGPRVLQESESLIDDKGLPKTLA